MHPDSGMDLHTSAMPALSVTLTTNLEHMSVFILKSFSTFSLPDAKHEMAELIETDPCDFDFCICHHALPEVVLGEWVFKEILRTPHPSREESMPLSTNSKLNCFSFQ